MNSLTTRKIVLGMLMTLVLVFSVQGIVDALTTDIPTDPAEREDFAAKVIGGGIDTVIDIVATPEDSDTTESITIKTSGIRLTRPDFATTITYSEATAQDKETATKKHLSPTDDTSILLDGYFTSLGKRTITITYTDIEDPNDASDEALGKQTYTYTYYSVKADRDISRTTSISLQGVRNGFTTGVTGRQDFTIYNGTSTSSSQYPVTYIVPGAGIPYYYSGGTRVDLADGDKPISSAIRVYLDANGDATFDEGGTNVVTIRIGNTPTSMRSEFTAAYIYGTPTLDIDLPDEVGVTQVDITGKYSFIGGTAGEDAGTITATVRDGKIDVGTLIPGVVVQFDVVDKSVRGGWMRMIPFASVDVDTDTDTDTANGLSDNITDSNGLSIVHSTPLFPARTLYVRTDSDGEAKVTYRFGTASGTQRIAVSAVGKRQDVTAELESSDLSQRLSRKTTEKQPRSSKKFDLVALVVDSDGDPDPSIKVRFTTNAGTLTPVFPNPINGADVLINTAEEVEVRTDTSGEAHVVYDIGDNTGRQEIHASVVIGEGVNADRQSVTFVINRSATPPPTARLTITSTGAGTTRTVTVNAINAAGRLVTGVSAVLGSFDFTLSEAVTTGTATIITLPSTPGNYRLLAADPLGVYAQGSITVPLVAPAALGTLTITTVGASVNRQQTIQVTARKADGTVPGETFSVALTGAGISRTVDILPNGSGRAIITLPATAGPHTLTVRADGYTDGAVTLTTTGQTVTPTTPPTPRGPVGEVDSVEIDGQRQLSSTVNQVTRLRVRVLDANDNGVADVRVTFRVLAPGRGTFSGSRGNGRGVTDESDRNGYASANFTPSDDGDIIVRATAAGVRDPVTFIIDVGAATADTETPTPSRDVAPSREISPVVHLGVASRPPMLWVDGGAIYALVGASAQKFAPGVDNALNITVGGGKVYWTEKTGESGGTVNSANLNGSDVKELASIFATPIGIAVDTAGSKLYWTNSRGRIQSANLDGSGITNELQDLPSPMDIALARGLVYWTQGNGSVRFVNLTGQRIVRDISTGTDTPGSLVIGGGKVYWTEMTGDGSGTVNSANLNGTGATQLASILAVPMGIAVDGARSKLYWTNSRGRVQSADLDGSGIQNVVSGLGNPGELVLSNSIAAPAAAPAETASGSKYDVNGDGSVNNADSDAITVAIAAGATDAKYDVNGDGTVNVFDLVEIIANRDAGAAGAPTLFGMKMTAVQIDHLQEQIDLLIAMNDRSPAAMRTLIYLQQLLVTARPEKTQLLANYPNPFNPETWIPYELATDTDVRLTIYNTQGVVIRTLQLGHQSAGYYTGRDRAAYWDGRNSVGEQVASGLYFYQLETDEMSLMRKMVILK